ncbi:hypothetical protein ACFFLM_15555 [Deinococcus oregonensis]|uniref:HPr kinase n=1 Tax=Deinococcus oregonensis TaxID=1805970 RepID=A0ABV6B0V8_9DEIO
MSASHSGSFHSLDAQVTLEGFNAEEQRELQHHWGYSAGLTFTRTIIIRKEAVPPPTGTSQLVPVAGVPVPCWVTEKDFWVTTDLHVKMTGSHAVFTVSPGSLSPDLWLLAFAEVHRAGGWLLFHAAVATKDGNAIAITGESGAGKSTAALRLSGQGTNLLAEDQAWVRPADGLVIGFDPYLRVLPDTLARFAPHLMDRSVGFDPHGKHLLPFLQPGQSAVLRELLVFGLSASASRALQARAVWESVGVPLTAAGRQVTATGISALLRYLKVQSVTRENVLSQVLTGLSPTPDTSVLV